MKYETSIFIFFPFFYLLFFFFKFFKPRNAKPPSSFFLFLPFCSFIIFLFFFPPLIFYIAKCETFIFIFSSFFLFWNFLHRKIRNPHLHFFLLPLRFILFSFFYFIRLFFFFNFLDRETRVFHHHFFSTLLFYFLCLLLIIFFYFILRSRLNILAALSGTIYVSDRFPCRQDFLSTVDVCYLHGKSAKMVA